MGAKVTIAAPGTIGSVDAGWFIQEDITPHIPGLPSASAGLVSFSAEANDDTQFVFHNASSFSHVKDDGTVDKGTVSGRIASINDGAVSTGFTQTTALSPFVAERTIPAVGSGSPVGSLDLVYQLAGTERCSLTTVGGQYWSLAGHDVGFDDQNNPLLASDDSTVGRYYDPGDFFYLKLATKVVDYASASSWATVGDDIWATAVTGSSPYPVAGEAAVVMFRTKLNGADMTWTLTTGPEDLNMGTGIVATVVLDYSAQTLDISGTYNPGGVPTPISVSSSIAGLNRDTELQVVISFGWIDDLSFALAAKVCNTSAYGTVVTTTTGTLAANMDSYSEPWRATGNIRGLYQIRTAAGYAYGGLLAAYENALPYDVSLSDNLIDNPIAGYVGTMWDYLNQVAAGTRVEYQIVNDRIAVRDLGANPITFDNYLPIPQRSIGSQGMALAIDAVNYSTSRVSNQVVYDSADTNETWSLEDGEVRTVIIETDDSVTIAFTPVPIDYADWLILQDPLSLSEWASNSVYVVSGSDNLPIAADEWVDYGGSVIVDSAGTNRITVTFTAPPSGIPGVPTPYSFSITDGSTTYPSLLIRGSGSLSSPVTSTWPTGADPSFTSVEKGPTLDNVAIGSTARLYSALSWAAAYAAGPILSLSFTMSIDQFVSLGLFSGCTFTHKNQVWRIITASVGNVNVSATAIPFTTANDLKETWAGQTVADLIAKWSGKKVDDFNIEPLDT